jgi:hypothetical protein
MKPVRACAHRSNEKMRLQLETLEDRVTPSSTSLVGNPSADVAQLFSAYQSAIVQEMTNLFNAFNAYEIALQQTFSNFLAVTAHPSSPAMLLFSGSGGMPSQDADGSTTFGEFNGSTVDSSTIFIDPTAFLIIPDPLIDSSVPADPPSDC